jgi:leucyl/phenylalanyl-tRNA---protein transferase
MRKIISPDVLLSAYRQGYFPMAEGKNERVYWHFPKFRAVFDIENTLPGKNIRKLINKKIYICKVNNNFESVITHCANRDDTWISPEIIESYTIMHRLGFAHSVETYYLGELVGGLYGVAIGGAFFGESMFNTVDNSAKVAFYFLIDRLRERGFKLLDSQYINYFTQQLGAYEISHLEYLNNLDEALKLDCKFD